jgi:hypothetical protein
MIDEIHRPTPFCRGTRISQHGKWPAMNRDDIRAWSGSAERAICAKRQENIFSAPEKLYREMRYRSCAAFAGSKVAFCQACKAMFVTFIATLIIALPALGSGAGLAGRCLVRQSANATINKEDTYLYEHKLFVTPDEVARYVFLTNRSNDGDRSAAVYRVQQKKGSLPGDFWITATVAADSVRNGDPNVPVRRYDAPLPASTASVLHKLWLVVLKQSRTDDEAISTAPTAVLSVVTDSGARLSAVTTSLDEEFPCLALLRVGQSLIEYAKLPARKRQQASAEIEKEARHLLQRNK